MLHPVHDPHHGGIHRNGLPRLPIEQMGLLTLGLALTGEERQVLEALLAGKKVKVLETNF